MCFLVFVFLFFYELTQLHNGPALGQRSALRMLSLPLFCFLLHSPPLQRTAPSDSARSAPQIKVINNQTSFFPEKNLFLFSSTSVYLYG